jgi:transposase
VAERCADAAVPKSMAVDLALMSHCDALLRDLELSVLTTAKEHPTTTLSWLRTVPGGGEILSLVRLDAIHDIHRFPRVQDVVSSCRLLKGAKASAGKRYGTGGSKLGHADLKWAFSEAAGRFWRDHPAGPKDLTRWEKKHGTGTALTIVAHHLARAVYCRLNRHTAFEMSKFLNG